MKKKVTKQPRVALCRKCNGMGSILEGEHMRVCPQCGGSGRVWVSAEMEIEVKPFN